jgi:pimeloyl-ACP methyl ester carboxylesterase
MGDRKLEVWYPAERGSESGLPRAVHTAGDFLPAAILGTLPAELTNLRVEMPAYRDIPLSSAAPFPVMTFSHGAGGFRLAYSNLLAGIASHGFVVASIDHLEWGLLAQLGGAPGTPRDPRDLVLAALDLLRTEYTRAGSLLKGAADVTRVATAGHSAGGYASFALPDRPEVKAMIGYATVGVGSGSSGKPILLVVGTLDELAGPLEHLYEALPPTKRFVAVDNAGHGSFTDQCALIHRGTNVVERARDAGLPLPVGVAALATNGCREENLPPAEFWRVVQHFTVAHLRAAFGIDTPSVALRPGVARAFGNVRVVYRSDG